MGLLHPRAGPSARGSCSCSDSFEAFVIIQEPALLFEKIRLTIGRQVLQPLQDLVRTQELQDQGGRRPRRSLVVWLFAGGVLGAQFFPASRHVSELFVYSGCAT